MEKILIYIECSAGEVTDLSLQCLLKGQEIARHMNGEVHCLLVGAHLGDVTDRLSAYGVTKLHLVDNNALHAYVGSQIRAIFGCLAGRLSPRMILLPASTQGNDLASALALELDYACVLDARQITPANKAFIFQCSALEGKALLNFKAVDDRPAVVTLKDGIVEISEASTRSHMEIAVINPPAWPSPAARVTSQELAKKLVNLKAAKIIVTAGAGVGSADNCRLVEKLAAALGGEIGATRPVVDAGWLSADRQIGQTGVAVKPDLYVAVGVSGAIQHRVGMEGAKKVIAINTDAAAPIFKIADYSILGDCKEVIPRLIDLIRR